MSLIFLRVTDLASGMFIPDPNFFHSAPGSASKHLSILTQKMVVKISEIWSGLLIPDPASDFTHPGSWITDPGVKKAQDPGSAILHNMWSLLQGKQRSIWLWLRMTPTSPHTWSHRRSSSRPAKILKLKSNSSTNTCPCKRGGDPYVYVQNISSQSVLRMRFRKNPKLFGPDPIRNWNKHFGSEKICKKEPYFQAKIRLFHTIIHK